MVITRGSNINAGLCARQKTCDWCSEFIEEEAPTFVWVGSNFILRGHADCFSEWFVRLLPDAYRAMTGNRIAFPRDGHRNE